MQGEQGSGSPEAAARFRRRLADLKRNGCNVLLVGTDATDAACERLLGDSSAGPRYRLFVTTDARPETARAKLAAVQPGPYTDSAAVVNWHADVRGGVAADGPGTCDGSSTVHTVSVESDDLGELGSGVEDAIASFEADPGDFSPAELRLCFDSMTPLVADYDGRDVRRFLLRLTETVESVDGMGHYHLPAEYDSETVASVEPLFDAVVEVRQADARVEQRWRLSNPDVITEWLPL